MLKNIYQTGLLKVGFNNITVLALHGSYLELNFPKVNTAHMKNPDYTQLPNSSSPSNSRLIEILEQIAYNSKEGLMITSDYKDLMNKKNWPLKDSQLVKTGNTGLAYYASNYKNGDGYMKDPREYYIHSNKKLCKLFFKSKFIF